MRHLALTRRVPLSMAFLALAFWPLPAIGVRALTTPAGDVTRLEQAVDATVRPGDDFFAYANGAWLKANPLPTGRERWTVRDELTERARRQIAAILADARTADPGSLAGKVAAVRAAFLNTSAIEARGRAPLEPLLARIDRVEDAAGLARLLGSTMPADVDPLNAGVYASASVLGFAVQHGIQGETTYGAFLLQGGLGLGERDLYLSQDAVAVDRRGRYQAYIARLLTLAGFDRAAPRATAILALEAAIAESHATDKASAVDRNADQRWTRADFARDAPGLDWSAFLDAAGLGDQPVVVAWQPSAVTGVAALVGARPLETWKDYLRFHAIHDHADVLPRAFADAAATMRGDQRTRDQRALVITQSSMAQAIGELYAARYFAPAEKARVRRIVADVTAAFRERVASATWLSPASRQTALAKVDRLYVGIGYPEAWPDWSDLRIDASDPFGNAQRLAERNRRQALARLSAPYDPHEWGLTPQTSGAVLNFQQNAYLFAAALLQPPKYDATASEAECYGAIGAIIGHDMSHFVDELGADYEPDGRMRRWWTAADLAGFEAAADPLVRQFSAYEPIHGLHVDGRRTRTENVADLAGLTAAFAAYRASPGARSADPIGRRRQDRAFFLAFAQAFGATMNEAGLRAQLANTHAPERYRMNTVRNLDAWYEAFDVRPGQRLHLEPGARVRVW